MDDTFLMFDIHHAQTKPMAKFQNAKDFAPSKVNSLYHSGR
jgi:hypothetical protein